MKGIIFDFNGTLFWDSEIQENAWKTFGKKLSGRDITDEEFNKVRGKIKGEVTRNKGLGQMPAEQAHRSMFTPEYQRLEVLRPDEGAFQLLEDLMGDKPEIRTDYVFKNIDFSEIRE